MADKIDNREILLLIDSHALIHRAFHAFSTDLTTSDGEVVNAVYGFTRLLLEVLFKFKPDYVVAAMDSHGPTIRHSSYGQYKANRKPTDDVLSQQFPRIDEILQAFDIPILKQQGYEADDIIGTLDLRHSGPGKHTIIVTGDRDLFQLVDGDTSVYMAGSAFSQSKLYDAAGVQEKIGLLPEQVVDWKAIAGDSSDNIPGVAGIGDKGALTLLSEFGTLDNVLANIDKVAKRYQQKLAESVDIAYKSRELATIIREAPISFDFTEASFGQFSPSKVQELFRQLEFKSLLNRPLDLQKLYKGEGGELVNEEEEAIIEAEPTLPLPVILEEWHGEPLTSDVLFAYFTAETSGDPLTWTLNDLILADETTSYRVDPTGENLAKLAKILLTTQTIVTCETKCLIHAMANHGLLLPCQVYDLALSTFVASAGVVKQDWDSIRRYYRIKDDVITAARKIYALQQAEAAENYKVQSIINLENQLTPVVASMERNGIILDVGLLKDYTAQLDQLITKQAQEIYANVGHEFNIASPKQVGEVLFGELNLPGMKKTKSGGFSTDERILRELINAHPVVSQILTYRELTKLQSTYVKPLPTLVNPKTGRLHTNYRQIGAVTGRFASLNPNLQNIPTSETAGISMRKAFVASDNSILLAFDYSQQELRLLAELSGEENMMESFVMDKDIHATTAAEIFDIPFAEVSKEQRKVGKTINFGVVYGISAFGLADRLKIDQHKAAEFIKKYFVTYPKIKTYYQSLLQTAKEQGYAETLFGRRRSATDYIKANARLRAALERELMNFPLQGSAADILKMAMINIASQLDGYPVKMLLQVHDELVFEYAIPLEKATADAQLQEFIAAVKQAMLNVVATRVPFAVGVEYGCNWAEMESWPEQENSV